MIRLAGHQALFVSKSNSAAIADCDPKHRTHDSQPNASTKLNCGATPRASVAAQRNGARQTAVGLAHSVHPTSRAVAKSASQGESGSGRAAGRRRGKATGGRSRSKLAEEKA